jgi:hypothetical protein
MPRLLPERSAEGDDDSAVPSELLAFDAADWPHEDPMLRRVQWLRARQQWEREHRRCGPWRRDDPTHLRSGNNFVGIGGCTCAR